MENLRQKFMNCAASMAAHLPEFLAQSFTLSDGIGEWYKNNGYFKFPVGAKIDCKSENYYGYDLNPLGWTVREHAQNSYGDAYVVETTDGELQTHFKWNIENQFKIADPNA